MAVVNVREVGVLVAQGRMLMHVAVCCTALQVWQVLVLMVFVVAVLMGVLHRFMYMVVRVAFGQVQPDAASHQRAGQPKSQ
jgi:heme/copper-type cytochrome/quinol oxidase subunit 2